MAEPLPVLKYPYSFVTDAPDWVKTRWDGCPECFTRDNQPLLWAIADNDNGLVCAYRCNKCGHGWWTSWAVGPVTPAGAA
jgi:hypothetical protein